MMISPYRDAYFVDEYLVQQPQLNEAQNDEELILDWTTAIEALDLLSIQEIYDFQPELLWTPLQPLAHLENDFSHFINKLQEFEILGTSIRPVYALHHVLFDYGLQGDEWAPERVELVNYILKRTKGNELNTCLWGNRKNTVMHLAYMINQPELTQKLIDKGALVNIPNQSGYLPRKPFATDDTSIDQTTGKDTEAKTSTAPLQPVSDKPTPELYEDSQPEVKLLINKSKSAVASKERIPANASDRFKRLRELAESPNANKNKPISERQNSTRRYFRPGHLEERKRRVLSEEEEAELEKQRLRRQKEVELLAQRSAVKNNPLFKKFEKQTQDQLQQQKPAISAVSAMRDRQKLLGSTDQIRRSSRVINSLKDRSYVSGSVFRQQSDTADGLGNNENSLKVPTLAQLRAGSSTPTAISRETSPNVSDNEDEEHDIVNSLKTTQPTEEKSTSTSLATNAMKDEADIDSLKITKENPSLDNQKVDLNLTESSFNATQDFNVSTAIVKKTTESDIESLSVGKLSMKSIGTKQSTSNANQVGKTKVRQIVNAHEHLNHEEEIEIYSTGKVFSVWKKDEHCNLVEEKQPKLFANRVQASEAVDKVILDSDSRNDVESKPAIPPKSKSRPISKAIHTEKGEKQVDRHAGDSTITIDYQATKPAPYLGDSISINDSKVVSGLNYQKPEEQQTRDTSTKEHDQVLQDNELNLVESTLFESASRINASENCLDLTEKERNNITVLETNKALPVDKRPVDANELPSSSAFTTIDTYIDEPLRISTVTSRTNTSTDDEDDEDQDSAMTPTLANPQPEQQKQVETLVLLHQRENFKFQDNASQIDDKTSFCSSTNESNVLRGIHIQQENHFNQWTHENEMNATGDIGKKRQSGTQRNYWAAGIQMVEAAATANKRESVASSTAAHSASEAGSSDQWFDPDDNWTVDSRRQSELKTSRHSDSSVNSSTFSYKHSDLTENTRLEEEEDDDDDSYSNYKHQVRYDYDQSQTLPAHNYQQDDDANQQEIIAEQATITTQDEADGHYYSNFDNRGPMINAAHSPLSDLRPVENDEENDRATKLHTFSQKQMVVEVQPRQLRTTIIPDSEIVSAAIDRDSDSEQDYYHSTNLHAMSTEDQANCPSNQSEKEAQPRQVNIINTIPNFAVTTATIDYDSDDYYATNLHANTTRQDDIEDDDHTTILHAHSTKEITTDSAVDIQPHSLKAANSIASVDNAEEDDYYSTMLHTAPSPNRTREKGMSSYYHHNEEDEQEDHEEEGEITVFMNHQYHPHPELVVHNQSLSSLHSTITQRNLVGAKTEANANDDAHSMYRIPSCTIDIADAGIIQASVPHDPNNPRIEDISHYMNALPAFGDKTRDLGGSIHDLNQQQDVVVKRAISTKENVQLDFDTTVPYVELNPIRGIPNAHEVNEHFMNNTQMADGGKISMSSFEVGQFGKMYIGVSGAHYMLLPLPKEITYVRCVISDGEYEYMSRYEVLGHQILMDYECIIDTKPGMIITVSLHVRPDYHVKPKTGWSRWFTSVRKQKEHLSGYVHPDDGAIGQTRFAVDHMVPGCYKKTYEAHFDCFNSWYARTTRERARREQFGDEEDFLKIVGKLNVEMLYLPVSNPTVQVPRSLRECDLTLKIRQWHDTCWQSGYLSTRRQGNKIWERHYYRLIGSQLIGYTSEEKGNDRQVWDHYNIADVLKLSAAADKVIITLVEEDTSKVFTDSIHSSDFKGFFRLTFTDYHLDCVSDDLDESEEWVKTLKSMIGRVPLRLPFSD
ncbi:hypothetical protein [Parasitella parasitica]|uniref:PH domain-containing protein n=1 Tax=Parasitella parasitica TaxID=35722 RepID=A0A0B7NNB5_9FUNG|nr:hypothetical protein [Parasitella parasitica]